MTPKSSYVLVGLFVLLLGIAMIAGILWLSTGGPPEEHDFYLSYMTESVSGLNVDAPVTYKGVDVGRVRDIRLNPENPEEVRLLLDSFEAKLELVGMEMDDLVSVQIFCPELELYDEFNAVYRTYFDEAFPARAFIGSGPLLRNARFEINGVAVRR